MRVNPIAALVDPLADWEERFRTGSHVDSRRYSKNSVTLAKLRHYRSVCSGQWDVNSRCTGAHTVMSLSHGMYTACAPETGSTPTMIDLINWSE